MTFFFINSRTLWKHFLWHNSYISTDLLNKQKQPFADVLQNRYSQKFRHIHRKTPVLESFLNKVTDLRVCSFIKQRLQLRCFHENIAKFLITAFFIKHLQWLLLNKVKTNVKSTFILLIYYGTEFKTYCKTTDKSSRPEGFRKKGVLINFA